MFSQVSRIYDDGRWIDSKGAQNGDSDKSMPRIAAPIPPSVARALGHRREWNVALNVWSHRECKDSYRRLLHLRWATGLRNDGTGRRAKRRAQLKWSQPNASAHSPSKREPWTAGVALSMTQREAGRNGGAARGGPNMFEPCRVATELQWNWNPKQPSAWGYRCDQWAWPGTFLPQSQP